MKQLKPNSFQFWFANTLAVPILTKADSGDTSLQIQRRICNYREE